MDACESWLKEVLSASGAVAYNDIRLRAYDAGFTRGELKRARIRLGVKTYHQSEAQEEVDNWFWYLED